MVRIWINTELVRASVNVLLKSGIDISGCKDEEEVERRLLKLIKKPQQC